MDSRISVDLTDDGEALITFDVRGEDCEEMAELLREMADRLLEQEETVH